MPPPTISTLPTTPPSSPPPPAASPLTSGTRALGPKSGAKVLASAEVQQAINQASTLSSDTFSIREQLQQQQQSFSSNPYPPLPPQQYSRTRSSSDVDSSSQYAPPSPAIVMQASLRRAPQIPSASEDPLIIAEQLLKQQGEQEGSMRELTRRASAEDQGKMKESISKGTKAGLGSPFHGAGGEGAGRGEKKRPPVSGVTSGLVVRGRSSSGSSTGSTNSVNKDILLSQLAEALRKERRKCKLFEEEIFQAEEEIDQIEIELEVMKEKFDTTLRQQSDTMASLRCEIDEVKHELESAYDLAPEIAQEFLDLLSTAPSPSKGPLIAAFNPKSLSTNKPPLRSKSKAQRRVNAQLATQDTSDETDNNGKKSSTSFWRRPRTRSKSRNPSTNSTGTTTAKPFAPLVSSPETLNKPSLVELGYFPPQQQQTPTPILRQSSYGPPPPAPAINPFATPVIERTEESGGKKKKRPPISGNNSNNKSLPDVPLASTPTTDGGRRRSNSLTKALRIMFPAGQPGEFRRSSSKDSSNNKEGGGGKWLQRGPILPIKTVNPFDSR